uniref:Uncharacterized protein n=1 Tax=Trichogramma kaykai TaxID=54128 RepID=A0ABD2WHN6_9HYME
MKTKQDAEKRRGRQKSRWRRKYTCAVYLYERWGFCVILYCVYTHTDKYIFNACVCVCVCVSQLIRGMPMCTLYNVYSFSLSPTAAAKMTHGREVTVHVRHYNTLTRAPSRMRVQEVQRRSFVFIVMGLTLFANKMFIEELFFTSISLGSSGFSHFCFEAATAAAAAASILGIDYRFGCLNSSITALCSLAVLGQKVRTSRVRRSHGTQLKNSNSTAATVVAAVAVAVPFYAFVYVCLCVCVHMSLS